MNPILNEAINTLSIVINVSTGLAHPLDDSRAKELFKALKKYNIPLNGADIYSLAISNSWPEPHAKQLVEVAEKIERGDRVKIRERRDWGEPTVRRIIAGLGRDV